MDVYEFFRKAKDICDRNHEDCRECPITDYCCDGIFAENKNRVIEMVVTIENAED